MNAPNGSQKQPAKSPAEEKKHVKPPPRWLKKALRAGVGFVVVTLAIVVAIAATLWWWTGTSGSLAVALNWAAQSQPLTAERVSGAIRTGGRIDRLMWRQDGLTVEARGVSLIWKFLPLLHGQLELSSLAMASLLIEDQRAPFTEAPTGPPTALGLPIRVALNNFSVDQLRFQGKTAVEASGISGGYAFNGFQHQLDLSSAQFASGQYNGRAVITSNAPLVLEANLLGALQTSVPNSTTVLPLTVQVAARGPLTDLQINAALQVNTPPANNKSPVTTNPQASATARVMPWAAQPLPQAEATFKNLNIATLWPDTPQTLLTGSASVRPADNTGTTIESSAWLLDLEIANALHGPWNQQRLPLEQLKANGEWRDGTAFIRSLKAQLAGGELIASGEWVDAATATTTATATATATSKQAWKLQATLQEINPAKLHTQLSALPLNGRATVNSKGALIDFEASVKALLSSADKQPSPRKISAQNATIAQLKLRDASAKGSWNAQQSGGTLALTALQVRTDEAELSGQMEVQPSLKAGKANLKLAAPGLDATLQGDFKKASGGGEFKVQGRDASQTLGWLKKLPGLPALLQSASASGRAELTGSWQGGWLDPAVQAQLEVPQFDWQMAAPATSPVATTTTPEVLKLRAFQALVSGRLSQLQISTQGRLEVGQQRYALQLKAEGGRLVSSVGSTALSDASWQGVLKQFSLAVENPALGAGAWQLATRGPVPLKWTPSRTGTTPQGGSFESGAGEALLTAPTRSPSLAGAAASSAQQATLAWQPVRWRPGELITAGKLTGLPMAWIELFAGPQMAGAGLSGNLLLNGEWDATLSNTLRLKASVARSSGDLTVQAETTDGASARIAAGIKQASVTLVNEGDSLMLAFIWDSERAGKADGQLKTRLARTPEGGWLWPSDAPLNGQVRAQLPRLGIWSLLAPPGWRLRGSLGADIAISGTRAAPQLAGDLKASDLALRSVVDGIEFGNGRLNARLDGTRMRINEFTLQGAGDKGSGGSLTAQGEAGWVNGRPQVELNAKLNRLRASIRTDRQLTVSGEIQGSLKGEQTTLTGKLVVDKARILLPEEETPQLGDDVVVRTVRGSEAGKKAPAQVSASTSETAKTSTALKLAIELDLGRDFQIQGKGIDTRVRGSLALSGESLSSPRLVGTLNTTGGQYRAYGQRLDVEQGVLRFNGPVDNPALDILAIRPNLSQRVGVQITGTALLPYVRLYAQPELPDAEKLSWLVIGRSSAAGGAEAALLQQAALALLGSKSGSTSGGIASSLGLDELSYRGASSNADGSTSAGAVTLGKRFSRNFYAAYERSVSGALGTLFVFYDLSQRFKVRAQAGQQSALDLIFTVPYD